MDGGSPLFAICCQLRLFLSSPDPSHFDSRDIALPQAILYPSCLPALTASCFQCFFDQLGREAHIPLAALLAQDRSAERKIV
jgi:hypothetical protein